MPCRLCYAEAEILLPVYDDDGTDTKGIAAAIEKFLEIELNANSTQRSNICISCWASVDNFQKFFNMVAEKQLEQVEQKIDDDDDDGEAEGEGEDDDVTKVEIEEDDEQEYKLDFVDMDVDYAGPSVNNLIFCEVEAEHVADAKKNPRKPVESITTPTSKTTASASTKTPAAAAASSSSTGVTSTLPKMARSRKIASRVISSAKANLSDFEELNNETTISKLDIIELHTEVMKAVEDTERIITTELKHQQCVLRDAIKRTVLNKFIKYEHNSDEVTLDTNGSSKQRFKLPKAPIRDIENFKRFEKDIAADEAKFSLLVAKLSKLEEDSSHKFIKCSWRSLIYDEAAQYLCWNGTDKKIAVKNLRITEAIKAAYDNNYRHTPSMEFERTNINFFQQSKNRHMRKLQYQTLKMTKKLTQDLDKFK